jgi:thioredoxin reductase/Pyruvate/2-oxoacid:ferredoxin oxidoreductase delta subunit
MELIFSSWALLLGIASALGIALAALSVRRRELQHLRAGLSERQRAVASGTHAARLQYPHVDLARCLGCGTCVQACPEEGVLEILHGQAVVVHGARCVGHGRCAAECPVGAISVRLGDLTKRDDIPVLDASLESHGNPGLFLAGEVTGMALVRTAVTHGIAVASEVARRRAATPALESASSELDLCIVGAGPAGMACALEAKSRGLRYLVLEQEVLGGTLAKYPRRKLVMTQPVSLPLVGALDRSSYTKEELLGLWQDIADRQRLEIRTGQRFLRVERRPEGGFVVHTDREALQARYVCLALGRRGTPRKLGVPGEELSKVAYSLLDARSYLRRRILVVGGGDSAVEAALGLAEQEGNQVTLSYRKSGFSRLRERNEARMLEAQQAQRVRVLFDSEVVGIQLESVDLLAGPGTLRSVSRIPNDDVFVMVGGIPPLETLQQAGVSFDSGLRARPPIVAEKSAGLLPALLGAFGLALVALVWTLALQDYYGLARAARPDSTWHAWLAPSKRLGLFFGCAGLFSIAANLAYLGRRANWISARFGSLQTWMSAHVASGILALLLVLLHAGLAPQSTAGGHALCALVVLVSTGAIGRYLYAYVPRAANGRELALEEIQGALAALASEWDAGQRGFGERVRSEVQRLVESGRWHGTWIQRAFDVWYGQRRLQAALSRLRAEARAEGLPELQLAALLDLARRAHRAAWMAAHYEDLRGLMASWRYLHRWVALLLVLLVGVHIAAALRYTDLLVLGGSR